MTITISSPAFSHGAMIPRKYTGEGEDVSPPLTWSGVPKAAKELALVCDDPDAPTAEPWVHWVIYHIPPEVTGLPEGIPKLSRLKEPTGALQGKNSWTSGQSIGYRGPMPPPGNSHRYFFHIYALGAKLSIESGLTKKALMEEIADHVIAEGQWMGTYARR